MIPSKQRSTPRVLSDQTRCKGKPAKKAKDHFAKDKDFKTKPVRKFYLKSVMTSTLDEKFLQQALHKHSHLLSKHVGEDVQFVIAKSTQKNLFRFLFKQNWRYYTLDSLPWEEGQKSDRRGTNLLFKQNWRRDQGESHTEQR